MPIRILLLFWDEVKQIPVFTAHNKFISTEWPTFDKQFYTQSFAQISCQHTICS